jgi:hypothetical protein
MVDVVPNFTVCIQTLLYNNGVISRSFVGYN